MRLVRRHLRRGVAAWLLSHALTFTALLPRDCCAAHAHAAHGDHEASAEAAEPACHDAAMPDPAPGAHCAMAAAEGAACPMHARVPAPADCSMTGVCGAPAAMLQAVLMQAAVPGTPISVAPHLLPEAVRHVAAPSPRSLASPPDAPPPRA